MTTKHKTFVNGSL